MKNPSAIDLESFIKFDSTESDKSFFIRKALIYRIDRFENTVRLEGVVGHTLVQLLKAEFKDPTSASAFAKTVADLIK